MINEINDILDTINNTMGILLLLILTNSFITGVLTMFMLSHKVGSNAEIFDDDDSIFTYVICIIYIQSKFFIISYFSSKTNEKV